MEKLSQILKEVRRRRKISAKKNKTSYTNAHLAIEFGLGPDMIDKYLSGNFDKAQNVEEKITTGKKILAIMDKEENFIPEPEDSQLIKDVAYLKDEVNNIKDLLLKIMSRQL